MASRTRGQPFTEDINPDFHFSSTASQIIDLFNAFGNVSRRVLLFPLAILMNTPMASGGSGDPAAVFLQASKTSSSSHSSSSTQNSLATTTN
jgi:hypothetical protein